ncbi:hypothetical protein AMTR_s01641p00008060, partial [Amborella trichopoda]
LKASVTVQEPGCAEADFGRFDVQTVIRNIYVLFSGSKLPIAGDDQERYTHQLSFQTGSLRKISMSNLSCMKIRGSGFLSTKDLKVTVPALLVVGRKDYFLKLPGTEDYINSPLLKESVPDLEIVFMREGSHFVQEQFPEEINRLPQEAY